MKIQDYINKGFKFLSDSDYRFMYLAAHGVYSNMDDKNYLCKLYAAQMGKTLNLENPTTFNEKLQWLKLYNRDERYTCMVDKYAVKQYVAECIGDEYIIPTIGVWDNVNEIEWEKLPNQFVMKVTHDSGGLIICKDKRKLDIEHAEKIICHALKTNYYLKFREWPYKNVEKKIIAEQLLIDNSYTDLRDYKFFCFNGNAKFFKIDFDRHSDHHANYYDVQGKLLPFGEAMYPPVPSKVLDMPLNLKKMISLAETLAKEEPFLRVDFYEVNGTVYFGEITFYPVTGLGRFIPEEWDKRLGNLIKLPDKREKI